MSPRPRKHSVLVVGGAGYVGSFTVRALVERGEDVVVLDDLSRGHRDAVVKGAKLVRASIGDRARLKRVFLSRRFDTVLHFAAHAYVGESMRDPWTYWRDNVGQMLTLLERTRAEGVPHFVLSSSCTVYGEPKRGRLNETQPTRPVNPYGRTKLACEQILEDIGKVGLMRSFRLRYFNAAGAAADGSMGEDHDPETHLIPLTIRAAGTRRKLRINGDDWDTPDGTCVRDYVHVEDLAAAHVAAVDRLRKGDRGGALNLGTGRGASVKDVVAAVEKVSGKKVRVRIGPRRPGDPASLVAAPGRAAEVLGWKPEYRRIEDVVRTAWEWHRTHPQGYAR